MEGFAEGDGKPRIAAEKIAVIANRVAGVRPAALLILEHAASVVDDEYRRRDASATMPA